MIASLPPDQAEIIMLRVVAGLDAATVARIVGKTPVAVLASRPAALGWPSPLVTSAIVLGSTAAYIGVLPSRVQQMAHVTLGAPAPAPARVPDRPAGPRATAARPPLVKRPAPGPVRQPRPAAAHSATETRRTGRGKAVSPPRDHLRSGRASGSCTPRSASAQLAPVWKQGRCDSGTQQVRPAGKPPLAVGA